MHKYIWALSLGFVLAGIIVALDAQQPTNVAQIGGASPPAAICDDPAKLTSINIDLTAGTGNTQLIALSGTTSIFVCAFLLQEGGADGGQLIYGHGSACATGETELMTLRATADGFGVVAASSQPLFKAPSGEALCAERTNSVTLTGFIKYVQQEDP